MHHKNVVNVRELEKLQLLTLTPPVPTAMGAKVQAL
jgi:hypothetical protein